MPPADLLDWPGLRLWLHVVPQKVARAIGQHVYFSGNACKNGHMGWRSTGSSNCMDCLAEYRSRPEVKEKGRACARLRMQDPALREAANQKKREHHWRNRESELAKMKGRNAAYYQANKERIKAQVKEYQADNPEARRAYKANWNREALRSRPEYAAAIAMRRLLSRVCERIKMRRTELGGTVAALGYTTAQFQAHIERQFLPGMSWENRSEWHIDHIVPLTAFDLTDEADRKAANALPNLRPIWAVDNMQKADKLQTLL